MSGGHFNYSRYSLIEIAEEIRCEIANNDKEDEYGEANRYSEETLSKFLTTAIACEKIAGMITRVDYLLSGDDNERSFHERWEHHGL